MLRDKEWQEKDRLMLRDKKIYISRDEKLKVEVIWLYHNTLVEGHEEQ